MTDEYGTFVKNVCVCMCAWHGISPKTDYTPITPAYHHHHKTYTIPHTPLADMMAEVIRTTSTHFTTNSETSPHSLP